MLFSCSLANALQCLLNLSDNLFGFDSVVGCSQGHVVWQPNVEIEPVLDIFRKELLFEIGSHDFAALRDYFRFARH